MMTLDELLHFMIEQGASDLHLKVGRPPGLRVDGELVPLSEAPPLDVEDMERMVEQMFKAKGGEEQSAKVDPGIEVDFSFRT